MLTYFFHGTKVVEVVHCPQIRQLHLFTHTSYFLCVLYETPTDVSELSVKSMDIWKSLNNKNSCSLISLITCRKLKIIQHLTHILYKASVVSSHTYEVLKKMLLQCLFLGHLFQTILLRTHTIFLLSHYTYSPHYSPGFVLIVGRALLFYVEAISCNALSSILPHIFPPSDRL